MIPIKELRIGNRINAKFQTDNFDFNVLSVDQMRGAKQAPTIGGGIWYADGCLYGIPIYPDYLVQKLGFYTDKISYYHNDLPGSFLWYHDGHFEYKIDVFGFDKKIKYLHELQNIYHSLTGEELKIS